MNRLMIFAVLLFQSSVVYCQSAATLPGSPQTPSNVHMGQWPFDFTSGRQGQTAARPIFRGFDFRGSNTTRNPASAPIDFDHLLNAPDTDLKTHFEFLARNENPFSQSPVVVQPHSKFGPIPTQWPNAKTEQIPTQWSNLKLQPIDGGFRGVAPGRGSAK